MAFVLFDGGARAIIKRAFNNTFPTSKDLTLKLFTNNHAPADTDVIGTYTIATGGGYVDKALAVGSWVDTAGNAPVEFDFASQSFVFTGPLTGNPAIYGYLLEDGDGVAWGAEALAAPFTPENNGDHIDISPAFQLSKGTPT